MHGLNLEIQSPRLPACSVSSGVSKNSILHVIASCICFPVTQRLLQVYFQDFGLVFWHCRNAGPMTDSHSTWQKESLFPEQETCVGTGEGGFG